MGFGGLGPCVYRLPVLNYGHFKEIQQMFKEIKIYWREHIFITRAYNWNLLKSKTTGQWTDGRGGVVNLVHLPLVLLLVLVTEQSVGRWTGLWTT